MKVEAVTFDFWNTLFRSDTAATNRQRRDAFAAVFSARDVSIDMAVVDGVLAHVLEKHQQAWRDNRQFTASHALDEALALLGDLCGTDARDELAEAWLTASRRADVEPTPGVGEVLEALSGDGVRVGIVCDVGLTPSVVLLEYLERHDLLRYFDHWSFSDDVGVYKPHPTIFRHALGGLGVDDPTRALHVGDLRRTDIAGARQIGMTAVRYRGVSDDPPLDCDVEGDHVIDDLRELLSLVGA
ncbi:MAG TPA: HAD family hydrolase [Acidimicrobiales bacterium]